MWRYVAHALGDAGSRARVRLAVAVVAALAIAPPPAEPKFPALTGRIVDEAALLSADDRRALEPS